MDHTKTTTRINVNVSHAEEALEKLLDTVHDKKNISEHASTIQLVLKVCEHKLLRLAELEHEVTRLRAQTTVLELRKDADLVSHCVELEAELAEALRKIDELEGVEIDLQDTGTD